MFKKTKLVSKFNPLQGISALRLVPIQKIVQIGIHWLCSVHYQWAKSLDAAYLGDPLLGVPEPLGVPLGVLDGVEEALEELVDGIDEEPFEVSILSILSPSILS